MLIDLKRATSGSRGLSLTELLLIVAVIGVISAVAIPTVSRIRDSAKVAAATQNAKNVAQMSEALAALGVAHVIPDSMGGAEATARLLREGVIVPEGPMAGERFILAGMREGEIEETAEYLRIEYDETNLRLVFSKPHRNQTWLILPADNQLWCFFSQSTRSVTGAIVSGLSGDFFNGALRFDLFDHCFGRPVSFVEFSVGFDPAKFFDGNQLG
jgi:type II secretory pathway pseudopilin PulG